MGESSAPAMTDIPRSVVPDVRSGRALTLKSPTSYDFRMVQPERLRNAPVTEAVIVLKAEYESPIGMPQLDAFRTAVAEGFPIREPVSEFESEARFDEHGQAQVSSAVRSAGFHLKSPDQRRTIVVRPDALGLSHLKPYDRWEALRDEFKELWGAYCDIARPTHVTRIGVRYINSIDLPLPSSDFKEYIETVPEIAPGLPQGLASFLMRLVIPVEEVPAIAILTQAVNPAPPDATAIPLIFDIDTFREGRFGVGSDELWRTLEALRNLKNKLFFSSITQKAKDMYL